MSGWNANSPKTHPPCHVPCRIRTRNGQELDATLIHLNGQYHTRVPEAERYKWRLRKHNFVEDDQVVEWMMI